MKDHSMEEACVSLFRGHITFDQFARLTRDQWRRIARALMRWYSPPSWLSAADLEQELLLGAHQHIWKFDETKGKKEVPFATKLAGFVVWNAITEAKYVLHHARGVSLHGNPDRVKHGRAERPLSSYVRGTPAGGEEKYIDSLLLARGMMTQPTQEQEFDEREQVRQALRACTSDEERVAIEALVVGGKTISGAARAIVQDERASQVMGIRGRARPAEHEEKAAVAVVRSVTKVAIRMIEQKKVAAA